MTKSSRSLTKRPRPTPTPRRFLAANPDINYDDTFPIPLGEWVVVGSLPETVLFQADTYMDLFAQIVASFGPGVDFNIKPKQLAKTEALTALNRIQVQMSSLNKENGGYVLMNFSQLLDDELQVVLVYGNDVPRVLELCAEVGIAAAPSLEALKVADPRLKPQAVNKNGTLASGRYPKRANHSSGASPWVPRSTAWLA